MKGFQITLEQFGAVILLVIIVAFAFYFVFKEKIDRVPPQTVDALAKCTKHLDCGGNPKGGLCIAINGAAYDCGCLTNNDCLVPALSRCEENTCVVS